MLDNFIYELFNYFYNDTFINILKVYYNSLLLPVHNMCSFQLKIHLSTL